MSWAKWVSWRADAPAGVCAKIMGKMLWNGFTKKYGLAHFLRFLLVNDAQNDFF